MDLGIIQITNNNKKRQKMLIEDDIITKCIKVSQGNYTLVSPENDNLRHSVEKMGGFFSLYTAWDKDMSRKWRQGIQTRNEEWLAFFADDVYPDEEWYLEMSNYLKGRLPGQYGFRLTDFNDTRHEFGEDWMQFPNKRLGLTHRPLAYDIGTGYVESSPTAYVANCIVHRDVLKIIEPFGIFGAAPDVSWSMAIRSCGFPINFNPKAKCYHIGDREDNRK